MPCSFSPTLGTALNITLLTYVDACAPGIDVDTVAIPDVDRANPAASMTALLVVLSPRYDAAPPQRLLAQLVQRCGILVSALDSQRVPHRKVSLRVFCSIAMAENPSVARDRHIVWQVVTFGPSALPNRFVT